jgi:soluble lytic murein transglycosylase-like protein
MVVKDKIAYISLIIFLITIIIFLFTKNIEMKREYEDRVENLHYVIEIFEREILKKEFNKKSPLQNAILTLRPELDKKLVIRFANSVEKWSKHFDLDPYLVLSIIWVESRFKPYAQGPILEDGNRCVGAMMIYPKYHKKKMDRLGLKIEDLFILENNVRVGCEILREYMNSSKSVKVALKKYVGGSSETYIETVMKKLEKLNNG